MKRPYRIVYDTSTASSRELADWLAKDGDCWFRWSSCWRRGKGPSTK